MKVEKRSGEEIKRWQDWERPARAELHWKPGRSAMELAKGFFRNDKPAVPACIKSILNSRTDTKSFRALRAIAELKTALPHGASGPRNHDLWLAGQVGDVSCGIGIEAKADENFQDKISVKHAKAVRETLKGSKTKQAVRIDTLGKMFFGPKFKVSSDVFCDLRYQLFSGLAGTALQAHHDGAELAVFLVYEFETSKTTAHKLASNQRDYDAFVAALLKAHPEATDSKLAGPFILKGQELGRGIPVFVGKVRETL